MGNKDTDKLKEIMKRPYNQVNGKVDREEQLKKSVFVEIEGTCNYSMKPTAEILYIDDFNDKKS